MQAVYYFGSLHVYGRFLWQVREYDHYQKIAETMV
jgi:hypothetical protein